MQNDLLSLEADVFGPFDETGEVSLGLMSWPAVKLTFRIPRERDGDTTTH